MDEGYNEPSPHDALGDLTLVEYRVLHHPETSRKAPAITIRLRSSVQLVCAFLSH